MAFSCCGGSAFDKATHSVICSGTVGNKRNEMKTIANHSLAAIHSLISFAASWSSSWSSYSPFNALSPCTTPLQKKLPSNATDLIAKDGPSLGAAASKAFIELSDL